MAYYKIAESTSYDIQVELYEKADSDPNLNEQLFVLDFIERKGITSIDKYKPHLPYEVQVPVLDADRFLLNRIRNFSMDKFKMKVWDSDSTFLGEWYVNTKFSWQNFSKITDVLPLVGFDGITLLKHKAPVTLLQPIGKLFESLLVLTGIDVPVIVTSDIKPIFASGQNDILPNQYRTDPLNFVRGIDSPSAYDQLMSMLNLFKCQVFQEDGVWRVMEREARDTTSMNVFNISNNTAGTTDPTLILTDADLRAEPSENFHEPIARLRRVADPGHGSYEFNNGDFNSWLNNTELLYWDVSNKNAIQRVLQSDDVGFQFVTAGSSAYMSQHPQYTLYFRDRLQFQFKAEFEWHSSQQPDSTRRVNIARIRLMQNDIGLKYGLNTATKSFELNHPGEIYNEIDTNSFNPFVSFDFDFEVAIPNLGTVFIELYFTGDTAVVTTFPKFFIASLEPVHVADKPTKQVFTFSQDVAGHVIDETVRLTDPHQYVEPADFEYYDGSQWKDNADGWMDYNDDAILDPISAVVASKLINSSLSCDHLLNLSLDYNTNVKLFNSVLYTLSGEQRKYIPLFIERKRKARQARLQMIEIKSEAAPDLTVSYE